MTLRVTSQAGPRTGLARSGHSGQIWGMLAGASRGLLELSRQLQDPPGYGLGF
eukprot:NODE_6367_length_633_cov_2.977740_g5424_i0.p3 GENE.NODE_6367_length_633_cov_2.977740_g5424_i0~~NODE_6367_length_633_cov_2.977740_g5424_i0.p3  ORF type:complete len:53 (+),score=5.36 NODE_6367_length_633_cov_2.977740_g5424_i0:335-493(+)